MAETACEIGRWIRRGRGCEILGDIYAQGIGVKQDLSKAKAFYQEACENPLKIWVNWLGPGPCGGHSYTHSWSGIIPIGCEKLGDIYYLEGNLTETKKWWMKAIEKGDCNDDFENDDFECSYNDLSSGYFREAEGYYNGYVITEEDKYDKRGNLIKKGTYIKYERDYTKAVLLANMGCDEFKDFKSCYIYATAFIQGKGIKDLNKILRLSFGQAYLTKAKKYEAEYLYKEAKKLGQNICSGENGEYINDSFDEPNQAQAVAKQRAQIKELLQKACNLDKSNQACTDLKNKSYEKWNLDNVY